MPYTYSPESTVIVRFTFCFAAQAGYPPPAGYGPPPQQGGYPPQQGGYPPQQGGYPPQAGYPPQGGYQGTPGAPGYPPAGQQSAASHNTVVVTQPAMTVVQVQVGFTSPRIGNM